MAGGPCTPWITAEDLAGRPDMTDKVVDSGVLASAAADASNIVYVLSGRQFAGSCTATIRPYAGAGGVWGLPAAVARGMLLDSWMISFNGGVCWAGIRLGRYPVRAISQVKIDGVIVNSSQYRLDDQTWLVRKSGQPWPVWQRLDFDDTAVGTFSVSMTFGADPPPAGIGAASALAAELAKARSNIPHKLPQRVTAITRQQVSMVVDSQSFFKDGLTGIYETDLFIQAYNPRRQSRRPTVLSPDTVSGRRM